MTDINPAAAAAREAHRASTGEFGSQPRTGPAEIPPTGQITEDAWDEHYGPMVEAPDGGQLHEHYQIRNVELNRVWTEVEGDDGVYLIPGMHHVNSLGYVVSEKPWVSEDIEVQVGWYCPDCGGNMAEADDPHHADECEGNEEKHADDHEAGLHYGRVQDGCEQCRFSENNIEGFLGE